jgi:hypothetical protein
VDPTQLDNIRHVLANASDTDVQEGRVSYFRYNQLMHRLAFHYGVPFEAVTAAFVATSPNNDYIKNLRSAVSLIQGFSLGKTIDEVTVSTYKECAKRAWRVLEGEDFLSFTKGEKTRAFYRNIIDPFDPEPVTVDGHMIAIWKGKRLTMKEAVRFAGHYKEISDAVRAVAAELNYIPNQVQAILWFAWKRMHDIAMPPSSEQLSLLNPNVPDPWKLMLHPEDIRPFTHRAMSIHQKRVFDREMFGTFENTTGELYGNEK